MFREEITSGELALRQRRDETIEKHSLDDDERRILLPADANSSSHSNEVINFGDPRNTRGESAKEAIE